MWLTALTLTLRTGSTVAVLYERRATTAVADHRYNVEFSLSSKGGFLAPADLFP